MIDAKNIGAVTIDPKQAKVDCGAKLRVVTDGSLKVALLGCGSRTFDAGATPRSVAVVGSRLVSLLP
ncbi:hypothetical protein [Streptomyces sp. NL15-2K]|uniref:hypothetical protein n=1 Tax=Streptomyces sp. NL15-2K TaxID=376149 RepID=UPI000F57E4EC|nr:MULTISPECIES: hypothetical protein [Actinomycetes]WKX07033.1 hypothetical protein Q4V64_05810 [Kutzneria buriramensis]GCB43036.1 hypothetical protein SNL152K_319 [Streptomyces sp. NL15-2K]